MLLFFNKMPRGQRGVAPSSAKLSRLKGTFFNVCKCKVSLNRKESKQSHEDCAKFDRSPQGVQLMKSTHAD